MNLGLASATVLREVCETVMDTGCVPTMFDLAHMSGYDLKRVRMCLRALKGHGAIQGVSSRVGGFWPTQDGWVVSGVTGRYQPPPSANEAAYPWQQGRRKPNGFGALLTPDGQWWVRKYDNLSVVGEVMVPADELRSFREGNS